MAKVDDHAPGTLSWFEVSSKDLPKSRRFYTALFGWTYAEEGAPETSFYTNALKNGGTVAGVYKHRDDMPAPPNWMVYFATADADATAAAVKKAGGKVVVEPMDVMGYGRMVVFSDPTGAHLGLWEPKTHTGAQVANEHGAMCWAECNTADAKKATKFYAGLFDLSPQELEGPTPYTVLNRGKEPVAGVMQMTAEWKDMPPHWMPYFQVDDVDKALAIVEREGGKVAVSAFDTPYGRIAVISDPSGAHFSIMKPEPTPQ